MMKLTRIDRRGVSEYRIMFRALSYFFIAVLVTTAADAGPVPGTGTPESAEVIVDLTTGPSNTFVPAVALGAGVDGHSRGDGDAIYRPATLRAMRSVGMRPLSYRLRTELAIQAWHWNPRGRWSGGRHTQGYWTSDDRPGAPILSSHGYRLPRRGNTIDQAENNGYSRLADGDLKTFWKSNPYLDRHYTGEDNDRHPQWLIADLGERAPVTATRIIWGTPHAVRYQVQYWEGEDPDDPDEYPEGRWQTFPTGTVVEGRGGDILLRLTQKPVSARFLRVLMEESSGIAPPGAKDPRDALGYAVREVSIGTLDSTGRLRDRVRHAARRDDQTRFFVSSTDPWHRASDLDPDVEQPGIDRVFTSGITQGLPVLIPVGVLYDTPDNAAALLRYLRRRGYPTRGIELGEEPDGQYVAPEDYGALYLRAADALRAVDPAVVLGGPSFQSLWDEPMMAWAGTSVAPDQPWLTRWLAYLKERGRAAPDFLSFEWYPFDEVCAPSEPQLQQASALLAAALANLHAQGLSRDTPLLMTEYGYSAFSAQAEVDLTGALFNADAVGVFLTQGGAAAYLYGYEPSPIYRGPNCDTWGNNTLFLSDPRRRILARTATYHGATLLARQWAGNPSQPHRVYPARVEIGAADAVIPLSAYAVRRPDGLWAVLLINKDPRREWGVALRFAGPEPGVTTDLRGPVALYRFSAAQYHWRANREQGRPLRSHPPQHRVLTEHGPVKARLPPWSLTVIRGGGPREP
ncbi:MAG: discoidin domain-containing protein [Candidatus Contendobacter sp.]|nr:discoidin domain-containing protein [Candidatus Contendobacter sp.]